MLKLVILIKRREGMSREAFIDHYEKRHAPLVRSLLPEIVKYRRNYVRDDTLITMASSNPVAQVGLPFDVVTEAFYKDRASYEAMLARMANPVTRAQIAEDEERFADRSRTTLFLVDEHSDLT